MKSIFKISMMLFCISFLTPSVTFAQDSIVTAVNAVLVPNTALKAQALKSLFIKLNNRVKATEAASTSAINALRQDFTPSFNGGITIRDIGIPTGFFTGSSAQFWVRPSFGQLIKNEFGEIFCSNLNYNPASQLVKTVQGTIEFMLNFHKSRAVTIAQPIGSTVRLLQMMQQDCLQLLQNGIYAAGDSVGQKEVSYKLFRAIMEDYAKYYDPTRHTRNYNFPLSNYLLLSNNNDLYAENVTLKLSGSFFHGTEGDRQMGIIIDDFIMTLDAAHAFNWNDYAKVCPPLTEDRSTYIAFSQTFWDRFINMIN